MNADETHVLVAEKEVRIEAAVNAAMHHYGYSDDEIFHPNALVAEELASEERMVRVHLNAAELVDAENSIVRLEVDDRLTKDLILLLGELASDGSFTDDEVVEEVKAYLIARSEDPAAL